MSLTTFFRLIFCAFHLYSIIMLTVSSQYVNCELNHLNSFIFSAVLLCFFQSTVQKALIKVIEFSCSAQHASFNQLESCKFGYTVQSNLHNCTFLLSEQTTEFSQSEDCKLFCIVQHILYNFKISQLAACKFN